MKPLIISYASKGREDYHKMSENLYLSIKQHWKYDYRLYVEQSDRNVFEGMHLIKPPITMTPHSKTPYRFKYDLIMQALTDGYTHVFWCDSSISLSQCPLNLLLNSNLGVMAFHNLGHETIDYISDKCLHVLNANPNEYVAPQIWGGCIAFDFTKQQAQTALSQIIEASDNGAFDNSGSQRASFIAHRHDQATMSILFHRLGVVLYNYGHIICAPDINTKYGNYHSFIYGKNY
jgi:hypothetical protein